jgi:hypothetical protein
MIDPGRNYSTSDADYLPINSPNVDADDIWGDGLDFKGDALASPANRQSAMVDGHFGASVYWDLMSNVFGRQGADGKNLNFNIYTHWGPIPGWENAMYSPNTNSVYLGDGTGYQSLQVVGHELAHGLNYYTAQITDLSESNSDIWGAMTAYYLNGGGFAAKSGKIPLKAGPLNTLWTSVARNMMRPSAKNPSDPDYWFLTIGLQEVHQLGEPNNRAFYFLSEGASLYMTDPSYSELLPAGMQGIGTQDAARIWFDALLNWMPSDADYGMTRVACLSAAIVRFGVDSPQHQAVMNAYAGIGVGAPAPSYPATTTFPPSGSNSNWQTASVLPDPGPVFFFGGPQRYIAQVTSSGTGESWFRVTVNGNQRITVGVYPRVAALSPDTWQVEVYDAYGNSIGKASSTNAIFNALDTRAPSGFGIPQTLHLRVTRLAGVGTTTSDLAIQFPF